jgi:hypothetical protein
MIGSRFQYSCLYELDSLAVVNVRDLGGMKHAFKLLVFPETRLFQCANAPAKEVRGPFLTSPLGANFDPQGLSCPPGVNLSPKVEVFPGVEILCSPLHSSKQ